MKLNLISLFLIAVVAGNTCASEFYATMENDIFFHHDDDYTHGTKFEYVTDSFWHFNIQQNMYAPADLSRTDHIVGDRPYCGMLIGGIGKELFNDPTSPWTHYAEINFGMIGPSAHCKETQKFVHKIFDCDEPMGWDNQLHDEFVVNGQWWTKFNWFIQDWIALVPRVGVAAGTIQDMAEVGVDLKLGWNMRKDVGNTIMFSATPSPKPTSWLDDLMAYVYGGICERYYLYNHILEGGCFNNKDRDLGVDIEPFVPEARVGIVVQYKHFFATWYGVFRGFEFEGQKNRPDYGGISIGWLW